METTHRSISSTRSTSSPSTGNQTANHPMQYFTIKLSLTHPNKSNYTYVAGGWTYNNYANDGALIVATTTEIVDISGVMDGWKTLKHWGSRAKDL